jgi:hypothetical protein
VVILARACTSRPDAVVDGSAGARRSAEKPHLACKGQDAHNPLQNDAPMAQPAHWRAD